MGEGLTHTEDYHLADIYWVLAGCETALFRWFSQGILTITLCSRNSLLFPLYRRGKWYLEKWLLELAQGPQLGNRAELALKGGSLAQQSAYPGRPPLIRLCMEECLRKSQLMDADGANGQWCEGWLLVSPPSANSQSVMWGSARTDARSPSLEYFPGKMKWQMSDGCWQQEQTWLELLSQLANCSLIRTQWNPGARRGLKE